MYRVLLSYPRALLLFVAALTSLAAWETRHFTFDASADTLVVQGDPRLITYLEMTDLFGGDEFLVLTFAPRHGELFSHEALQILDRLERSVLSVPGVADTFSMLDAPLIESPAVPLEEMSSGYRTLRDPAVDLDLARSELTGSPLFREFLVAADGRSSAIKVDLEPDEAMGRLHRHRDELRARSDPVPAELEELARVEAAYIEARGQYVARRSELIESVRDIRKGYRDEAEIFISGVPMIAADMIEFVKSDLRLFGVLVFSVIVVLLFFFFRRLRWVVLPILISAISILMTMGILGFARKPVTVISANFISLLAIICISFAVHLIVRYRELLLHTPDASHFRLIVETMESKFAPCLYTGLTTMLAFGSMLGSRIVPVEDFGWMMCLGIGVAFLVTYSVFPSALLLSGRGAPSSTLARRVRLPAILSQFCLRHSAMILTAGALIFVIATVGLSRITFDNRFVDYFDEDTDIHAGMVYIDRHLGGTVPFDVYLRLGEHAAVSTAEDDFFSAGPAEAWPERYWFTRERIDIIAGLHDEIASKAPTGKVVSISTLERLARKFTDGDALTSFEMAYALGELPESIRTQLVMPYAKPATGYARINVRVTESGPHFSRDELIHEIERFAVEQLQLNEDEVIVTGMMVLFNDMLAQLAESQLRTLLYVVLATFLMFVLLLRSPLLAILALIPNMIAAASVVSFMGFTEIPMDMMTITIAAISIGIGVDNAIHYLHRFRAEVAERRDVRVAVREAHATIGQAMYYTSVVVIAGFSILAFSNFLPTVYFGLLTALAMSLALVANLTLLPSLLLHFYRISA